MSDQQVQPLTVPLMTVDHVKVLLGTLSALDPRLVAPNPGDAARKVSAWAALLQEVEPGYAMQFAKQAYSEPRDWPLTPAEILQSWRANEELRHQRADHQARQDGPRGGGDPRMTAYLRACLVALRKGEPVESVPRPMTASALTPEQEERSRRCAFYKICACPHTDCRAGVSDTYGVVRSVLGGDYPMARWCSHCQDARIMAMETGVAKRPARPARFRP